jgi:hypothetical protein
MSRFNGRADRWNVDEFVEELKRIYNSLPENDETDSGRQDLLDLMSSLLIDEADCGCKATINFKGKNVEIDLNPECDDITALKRIDEFQVEDVVSQLQEGKHLLSCVPGDGYCRCAVEMIGGLLQ